MAKKKAPKPTNRIAKYFKEHPLQKPAWEAFNTKVYKELMPAEENTCSNCKKKAKEVKYPWVMINALKKKKDESTGAEKEEGVFNQSFLRENPVCTECQNKVEVGVMIVRTIVAMMRGKGEFDTVKAAKIGWISSLDEYQECEKRVIAQFLKENDNNDESEAWKKG